MDGKCIEVSRSAALARLNVMRCSTIEEVASALRACGGREIHALRPMVGPGQDSLEALQALLPGRLWRLWDREWDAELFPLATRGFFPFQRDAGRLLKRLCSAS